MLTELAYKFNTKRPTGHQVNLVFDRPFYGMVFSKGHYSKYIAGRNWACRPMI